MPKISNVLPSNCHRGLKVLPCHSCDKSAPLTVYIFNPVFSLAVLQVYPQCVQPSRWPTTSPSMDKQVYASKGSHLQKGRVMNNDRGVSGERRESHSVTIQ